MCISSASCEGGVTRDLGDGRLGSKSSGIWEIGVQKIRDLGDWGKIWDMGDWVCKNIYTGD